jgi:hypothetical protein
MAARIVIFDEAMRGIDLPREAVILGRSRKADVPIRDSLLSRKHCTIVPHGTGLRLIDLKSSNGTFLNGSRIEKSDLKSEDVIEIGNTVIVLLLEEGAPKWSAGPGRLRNPSKARELIETLKKHGIVPGNGAPPARSPGGKPRLRRRVRSKAKRKLTKAEAAFIARAKEEFLADPGARELLRAYLEKQLVALLVKSSSRVRRSLEASLQKVLEKDSSDGGIEGLRARIAQALEDVLGPAVAPDARSEGDTPPAPPVAEDSSP